MHERSTAPSSPGPTRQQAALERTMPALLDDGGFEIARARNGAFAAAGEHEQATMFPALGLLVVTCLDPRVDPAHILGLRLGDAMVIRNGGGRVTPDVINGIAFVGELASKGLPHGPLFEVAVIHHTGCGAGALADDEFRHHYAERVGADESVLRRYAVIDPAATVTSDVDLLRGAAAISPRIAVSGHVYDVATGLIETVMPVAGPAVADRSA